jgi:hypothetical protein
LLLLWYLATVGEVAHHVCDGPHIRRAPVTADTSIASLYTYKSALLIINLAKLSLLSVLFDAHPGVAASGPQSVAGQFGVGFSLGCPRGLGSSATHGGRAAPRLSFSVAQRVLSSARLASRTYWAAIFCRIARAFGSPAICETMARVCSARAYQCCASSSS